VFTTCAIKRAHIVEQLTDNVLPIFQEGFVNEYWGCLHESTNEKQWIDYQYM